MTGPKSLDELIAVVPGVAKFRSLNADMLRRLLDRGRKECTWCGGEVPKGRRAWCSEECVSLFRARCCPQAGMRLVLDRDKGICQACGRDTIAAEREARALEGWRSASWRERELAWRKFGYGRHAFREVDHIVPVSQGGGLCGPDGMRLLCGVCHADATRRLAAMRANR